MRLFPLCSLYSVIPLSGSFHFTVFFVKTVSYWRRPNRILDSVKRTITCRDSFTRPSSYEVKAKYKCLALEGTERGSMISTQLISFYYYSPQPRNSNVHCHCKIVDAILHSPETSPHAHHDGYQGPFVMERWSCWV